MTYHDMAVFICDLNYDGLPFVWSEEERRLILAYMNALSGGM